MRTCEEHEHKWVITYPGTTVEGFERAVHCTYVNCQTSYRNAPDEVFVTAHRGT